MTPKPDRLIPDKHTHDWKLINVSNLSTRFANARPGIDTMLDIIADPGDSSETWACHCGERKFNHHAGITAFSRLTGSGREEK